MAVISKWYSFEASHRLRDHDGQCANLHGHGYQVCILLEGMVDFDRGPKEGMVLDYDDLNKEVKPIIDVLDHSDLANNVGVTCRTTAENIACYIWWGLESIKDGKVAPKLFSVRVKETPKTEASISTADYVRWKQHYLS